MTADKVKLAEEALRGIRTRILMGVDAKRQANPNMYFFGELLVYPMVVSYDVPTAATDGRICMFNPDYLLPLSIEDRTSLVMEELLHIALLHSHRKGERDHKLWNIACDMAIFELFGSMGLPKPSDGHVVGADPYRSFPHNQTADIYYSLLVKEAEKNAKKSGGGSGDKNGDKNGSGKGDRVQVVEYGSLSGDDKKDANGKPVPQPADYASASASADPAEAENLVTALVSKVASEMKQRGVGSALLCDQINQQNVRTPNYREMLRRFRRDVVKEGANWNRPNRRLQSIGQTAASRRRTAIADIVVLVDVSGSVSKEEIEKFLANVGEIYKQAANKIVVVQHTDEVVSVETCVAGRKPPVFKRNGSGGTSHIQPLNAIFEKWKLKGVPQRPICPNAGIIVCLTDMYSSFPKVPPKKTVIWASTTPGMKAPFGILTTV